MKAGLLMYDMDGRVFLVRSGGPYGGEWGIPKGELKNSESPMVGGIREFEEETGIPVDLNRISFSGKCELNKGTLVYWGYRGTGKEKFVSSNTFEMEWPKGSGQTGTFPEIDKGQWFSLEDARMVIKEHQLPILGDFEKRIRGVIGGSLK